MAEHPRKRPLRCAVYTRKSSEEGLEQDFNSLHAQREACEAFVISQKHEGWKALTALYDDGGFSGGSMERPALQKLLTDVTAGEIDVIVVYKVDRLTRSLTDFARIVEVFDKHQVSFVSVTQAFNTTSSMGRLTLNVLLSFAQFEREVTGERIRDKIAASKKKGLWMGGFVPIGYAAAGRTLSIREDEAATIRTIYARYLDLKSVHALKEDLEALGLKTRLRPSGSAKMIGGKPFSRGHLYRILSSPIYIGRIEHKGQIYDGQHPPIIDQPTFERVQATLAANSHARLVKAHTKNPSLLSGLLFDQNGERLTATHAVKQGRRYRYYFSRTALETRRRGRLAASNAAGAARGRAHAGDGGSSAVNSIRPDLSSAACPIWRLPAAEIENAVIRILLGALSDEHWLADHLHLADTSIAARRAISARARELAGQLQGTDPVVRRSVILLLVERIVLDPVTITVVVRSDGIHSPVEAPLANREDHARSGNTASISRPFVFARRGGETRLIIEGDEPLEPEPDPAFIKAVAQAHRWWRDLLDRRYPTLRDLAAAYDTDERYAASVLRLAFLSPNLTCHILDGTQQPDLTLHSMLKGAELPMRWSAPSVSR